MTDYKLSQEPVHNTVIDRIRTLSGVTTGYSTLKDIYNDGWIPVTDTWTYASANTINIPAGGMTIYQPGDRIRWKQGGAWKYGPVQIAADTLLTLAPNNDYSVANSAITDISYSHNTNPLGWPAHFNFSPGYAGFSAPPPVVYAAYSIRGKRIGVVILPGTTGTSNGTQFTITLPVATSVAIPLIVSGLIGLDNTSVVLATVRGDLSGAVLSLYTTHLSTVWTATGSKGMYSPIIIEYPY